MNGRQINSVALYFGVNNSRIPPNWVSGVTRFFESQGLGLNYFDISASEFFSDEGIYDFKTHKENLAIAVANGVVESIGLYSTDDVHARKSDWRAMASVEIENGMMFLGVDDAKFSGQELLLRSAYDIGGKALGVRYGISYKAMITNAPDCYAAGVWYGSVADLEPRLASQQELVGRLTAWRNESYGGRKYLKCQFRGAYRASIISEEHFRLIKECVRMQRMPGEFIPFVKDALWIWKLESAEIGHAETILRNCGLLIE